MPEPTTDDVMESPRLTIAQFVAKHHIRSTAEWADSNPNMDDMPRGSAHWRVLLRCGKRRMTVPFSQGPAICKEPGARDVLSCLASDAASYENAQSFEDWAAELGFSEDSRKAERIYAAVKRQTEALQRLLDADAYQELLWHTEFD